MRSLTEAELAIKSSVLNLEKGTSFSVDRALKLFIQAFKDLIQATQNSIAQLGELGDNIADRAADGKTNVALNAKNSTRDSDTVRNLFDTITTDSHTLKKFDRMLLTDI